MKRCESELTYRECVLSQGATELLGWLPTIDAFLGHHVSLSAREGSWRIRALTTTTMCERALRAKSEKHPGVYRILEVQR